MKDIILTTINAKWIHPSLALRLLKANLGELEERCEIIEFALRQPLAEKIDKLSSVQPRILGISVSIWNHNATLELLKLLSRKAAKPQRPIIIVGGPEVSYLPETAEIFKYVDHVIRGEGEVAFCELCEKIFNRENPTEKFIDAGVVDVTKIKTAYHLYTDEDVTRKLIYVEASRGCPFNCEFCLSACDTQKVREFLLEQFLAQVDTLIKRGAKTLKFLDRTFNANIKRAIQISEFFSGSDRLRGDSHPTPTYSGILQKSTPYMGVGSDPITVHFEMVPTLFTQELLDTLARFPPAFEGCAGALRLEVGIQTLNAEVAQRIGLPGRKTQTAQQILEHLRFLSEKTNAIIHADLIAGLPGETLESFAKGFDLLYETLTAGTPPDSSSGVFLKEKLRTSKPHGCGFEVQVGILKLLPGAPIARHNEAFGMRYNPDPPYEVMETSAMSAEDIRRIKNFARFWELIVNRGLHFKMLAKGTDFDTFMKLSDYLYEQFGRNWGIDKEQLLEAVNVYMHS